MAQSLWRLVITDQMRLDGIRNAEVRKRIVESSLREEGRRQRIRWFGLVKRMEIDNTSRMMGKLVIWGKRTIGKDHKEVGWMVLKGSWRRK